MASSKFNKTQVGLQTDIGTAVTPTIQVPWKGTYEHMQEMHIAEYDAGQWTPTTVEANVGEETVVKWEGTAFFEMFPVLFNSGFADVAPTGIGPYIHTYVVSPTAVGVPKPLTALFGTVGTDIGGTGPAVKLKDMFLRTVTLSANINDKVIAVSAELFGSTLDDNSGAGFAFASVGLPATLEIVEPLLGVFRYKDATTTGGVFTGMTDFVCSIIDAELVITTGIEPTFCLTDETTSWSELKYVGPSCQLTLTVRTNATNYAAIKGKSMTRTYQELQWFVAGTTGHDLDIRMTGVWDAVPSVHDDQDGEVVMKATFVCKTPYNQATTPHWLSIIIESSHNWT